VRINEELFYRKSSGSGLGKQLSLVAVGIRGADHARLSTRKIQYYFAGRGGHSVGIVRLRTKSHGMSLFASVPTMVYNDQNRSDYGLFPAKGFLNT
jgi:hypothetical protein